MRVHLQYNIRLLVVVRPWVAFGRNELEVVGALRSHHAQMAQVGPVYVSSSASFMSPLVSFCLVSSFALTSDLASLSARLVSSCPVLSCLARLVFSWSLAQCGAELALS